MKETDAILELRQVSFRYPDGTTGLDRCSIAIQRGYRAALVGANGSGKTTLVLHLNGILRPRSGEVLCDGAPLDYGRHGLRCLRSRVGLVFQNPDSQLFSASVREDVSFGPMNLGLERAVVRDRVEEALASVGLAGLADRPVHNLSYGQKKRVCIAGVLAMRPEVIILDEPMAGLDVWMQGDLQAILQGLSEDGITVLVATHDIDFAYQWADQIHVLQSGARVAGWGFAELVGALPQLAAFGIGSPRVAELHEVLAKRGLVCQHKPVPRSHEELVAIMREELES
jgi:cobalt/nickel transport system ATP-binding protein